jgi:pSer/pThr/pTyr-binding forkhead associated (FHA) protein
MAKLVVLSAGMTGRTLELKVDKTTIGRVEDNSFQIAEASVSSHHCEVLLRGEEVVVKDLNSTNGTFINGEKISESVLKPGQTLRLGQVDLRLEADGVPSAVGAAPAPPSGPGPGPAAATKKVQDQTMIVKGVSLNELAQGPKTAGFDTSSKAFSRKKKNGAMLFWAIVIIVLVAIGIVLAWVLSSVKSS